MPCQFNQLLVPAEEHTHLLTTATLTKIPVLDLREA
jgi:hypothetical protein